MHTCTGKKDNFNLKQESQFKFDVGSKYYGLRKKLC